MGRRIRIATIFSYDENWIAGTYYILNLINALNSLSDKEKPEIIVYTTKKSDSFPIQKTAFPYLKIIDQNIYAEQNTIEKYSLPERVLNKLSRIIFRSNCIKKRPDHSTLDFLFPGYDIFYFQNVKKLYWIPDLQEKFYPEYFNQDMIENRKMNHIRLSENLDANIVFSSNDSRNHFLKFYPSNKARTFVLHFTVTHPDISEDDIDDLLIKYKLGKTYFICPNQIWKHKNHLTVLKALKIVKEKGIFCQIVFTGKQSDHRNLNLYQELDSYVQQNQLQEYVRFTGFIERNEQLLLISESIAVVQPSLFEGWSTVVEDAKCLGKHIILSDIPIHREQIISNVDFFEPLNPEQLSLFLEKYLISKPQVQEIDYERNRVQFASDFIDIVKMAKA